MRDRGVWVKRGGVSAVVMAAIAVVAGGAGAQTPGGSDRIELIDRTGAALLDQIKCQRAPQVAHAINAMLEDRLIRYVYTENGAYLFAPNAPLTILGLRVKYISGFDSAGFNDVPGSTMVGTAPPVFLEIDVAASENELRRRALSAGLIEAVPDDDKRGFEVSDATEGLGSYLANERRGAASSIRCVDYPVLRRRK